MPYKDNLASLLHEYSFKECLDERVWRPLLGINKLGNLAVHTDKLVKPADAAEISADKPTAALVTHCPRRTRMNTGGCPERLPRCVWLVTEAFWPRFPGSRLLFYFRVPSLTGRLEAMGN